MYRKREFWVRSAFVVLAAMLFTGVGFQPRIVKAASVKQVPAKKIPKKRIPKTRRYYQAPAYDKRAKKNRRLVIKARRVERQLRRTGTAYEEDLR